MFSDATQIDPLAGRTTEELPPLLGAALDYPAGTTIDWHAHDVGQLIYAITGTVSVRAAGRAALLPPTMLLWVPATVTHRLEFRGATRMRTLYVRADVSATLAAECHVLHVTPLLRELMLTIAEEGFESSAPDWNDGVTNLTLTALRMASRAPFLLPVPSDPRLRAMVGQAMHDVTEIDSVASWVKSANASRKTVERLFKAETGMAPSAWLRQARLMHAVALLSEGAAVNAVADQLGYATPSAFTYRFRSALGMLPSEVSSDHRNKSHVNHPMPDGDDSA